MTPAAPALPRKTHVVGGRGGGAARCVLVVLLVVLGWMSGAREGRAQSVAADTSLRVETVGPSTLTRRPGTAFTARVRVANAGDRERVLRTDLELPDGWRTSTSSSPLTLAPGESTLRLLRVSIPSAAPAGREVVQFRAADTSDASIADTTSLRVQVDSVQQGRVAVAEAPRSVAAGRSYTAVFSVTNAGNVPLRTRHAAQSNRSLTATVVPPSDTLAPQETERVRVEVQTDAADETFEHRLTLEVRVTPGDTILSDRATTEVIPGGDDGGFFSGPKYPTTLRMFAYGSRAAQSGQVELEGSGALSTEDDHTVEMFVRTPDPSGGTRFGRRSRYSLSYTSSSWTLRAGDHTFERTRLAERGRRGTGGEVRYRTGDWTMGGYAFGSRFGQTARQGSAYAQYEAHPRAQLTANLVRNEGAFATGTLGTLRARLVPWTEAQLDLEAGVGDGENGQDGAYRADLEGDPSWGTYQLRHQQVGADFPSSFSGVQRTSAALSADLSEQVGVSGSLRRSVRDRAFDRTFEATTARVGATTRGGGERLRWSLGADALVDRRLLRDEELLRVQGGLQANAVGLRPLLEVGRFGPNEGGPEQSFRTYGLRTSVDLGPQRVDGQVEYTEASFREGFSRRPRWSADLSTQLQLGSRADLRLRGEWTEAGAFRGRRQSAQATLQYQLAGGHRLSAEARYRRFGEGAGTSRFRIGYTVPVGLPIVQTPDRQTLTGRVVDAETNAPLSEVLVQLGPARRLTDEEGRFSLPLSQDGPAYLRLDLASGGFDRVPMLNLPMRIGPEDTASDLVIPVSEGAVLHAQAIRYEYPSARAALEDQAPERVGGVGGLVVEVTDDEGAVRRLTGADGQATFDDLRPGPWTVRVGAAGRPQGSAPEQSTYEVTLSPGARDTLRIRMLPEGRPQLEVEEGGEIGRGEVEEGGALTADEPGEEAEPSDRQSDDVEEEPVPVDVGAGPFVVRVGPFPKWEQAVETARQIRADRPLVTIQSRDGDEGRQYEVWVGRYPDRRAAEEDRASLAASVSEGARIVETSIPASYALRRGAFAEWEGAVQRAEQSRQRGVPVAIHPKKWDGRILYRVWAGQYSDRAAAAQSLDTLARSPSEAYVVKTTVQAAYAVQVGAFRDEDRATRLVGRLRRAEEEAYIQSIQLEGQMVYRVMVGTYAERPAAEQKAEALTAEGQNPLVRRMPFGETGRTQNP